MTPSLQALARGFRLGTRLLRNVLEGVSEADAARRVHQDANSFVFVAAHAVDVRYYLAGLLGVEMENPLEGALGEAAGIDDVTRMPTLAEVEEALGAVSGPLEERIAALHPGELAGPSPVKFPIDDGTLEGAILFLLQHESYHVGQLGLLRKLLGHEALSWEGEA